MAPRTTALTGALLIALLLPASAQAAVTIEPLKPCYVTAGTAENKQQEGVQISATGFTPNSKVDLSIDGELATAQTGLQTDTAGMLGTVPPVLAPFMTEGSRPFTVTLTEQGNPANSATATAKTTALGVSVEPKRATPSRRIRFTGAGFTGEAPVYAHYLYDGTQRKRVRMTRQPGECGTWSVRRRQIPVRKPKTGLWTVQFDQAKRYVDGTQGTLTSVFVRLGIQVSLVREDE